jgi:hypothetical protein
MSEEQKAQPTREQMIQWYKDEIELASLRAELSKLQRDAAVCEAERINAIGAIAQMTQAPEEENPKQRKLKKETVTEDAD